MSLKKLINKCKKKDNKAQSEIYQLYAGKLFALSLKYSRNYQDLLIAYVNLYQSLGGGWITEDEIEKYAAQVAKERGVDVNTIDRDSLIYQGQIVDYYLTPEQEKARKAQAKAQRKLERKANKK